MSPEIIEINRKLDEIMLWMSQFETAAQTTPMVKQTIQAIVGAVRLSDLADVSGTDAASSGEVLKYDGSTWSPGTDNT